MEVEVRWTRKGGNIKESLKMKKLGKRHNEQARVKIIIWYHTNE
jgi:hypothetical protein